MNDGMETGERIVDAATELFAEHGYVATTTRAIAERAGVNEVTLFRRFTNKAGILVAIRDRLARQTAGHAVGGMDLEPGGQSDTGTVPDHLTGQTAREQLWALAQQEVRSAQRNGGLAIRLALDARVVPEVRRVLGDSMPRNLESLARFIEMHQESGTLRGDIPAETLAEGFFALTSSYVMYRMVTRAENGTQEEVEKEVSQLFDLYWSGAKS